MITYTETYDCPRITSTPPPCPSATSTNAVIAPTSSLSHDTTSTPQPTSVPPMPTEPSGSMVTTVTTTELVTEESTTSGPVTEESTKTELVTEESLPTEDSTSPGDNFESISVITRTPTEEPADNTTPTDPESAENSNKNSGNLTTAIVVVVVAIVMLVVLSILVSVLIGIVLFKKRTKNFTVTRTNLHRGITNQLYGTN